MADLKAALSKRNRQRAAMLPVRSGNKARSVATALITSKELSPDTYDFVLLCRYSSGPGPIGGGASQPGAFPGSFAPIVQPAAQQYLQQQPQAPSFQLPSFVPQQTHFTHSLQSFAPQPQFGFPSQSYGGSSGGCCGGNWFSSQVQSSQTGLTLGFMQHPRLQYAKKQTTTTATVPEVVVFML